MRRRRLILLLKRNSPGRNQAARKAHKKGDFFRDFAFDTEEARAYISRPRRPRPSLLRAVLLLWHD